MAVLISAAAPFAGTVAVAIAEPLDKESCANLQIERKKLLTREMQAALEHGPDWVKDHLDDESIEQGPAVLERGGADRVPLPGRRRGQSPCKSHRKRRPRRPKIPRPCRFPTGIPRRPAAAPSDDGKPSQAVADSDKTPPGKSKATR